MGAMLTTVSTRRKDNRQRKREQAHTMRRNESLPCRRFPWINPVEAPWEEWEGAAGELLEATCTSAPVDAFALATACGAG